MSLGFIDYFFLIFETVLFIFILSNICRLLYYIVLGIKRKNRGMVKINAFLLGLGMIALFLLWLLRDKTIETFIEDVKFCFSCIL